MDKFGNDITEIDDIKTFDETSIPEGADLVMYEKGTNPQEGIFLWGPEEFGEYIHEFVSPRYCILNPSWHQDFFK